MALDHTHSPHKSSLLKLPKTSLMSHPIPAPKRKSICNRSMRMALKKPYVLALYHAEGVRSMDYELHEQVSSREALAKALEEERATNKREIVQLQQEARQHQMAPTNTILPMDPEEGKQKRLHTGSDREHQSCRQPKFV